MRYIVAAIVLLVGASLTGCATPRIDTENGFGVAFEPAVGLSRVQAGEEATQEAIIALAEKVEGGEAVIEQVKEDAGALRERDITDSEWFWLLLAAAGLPIAGAGVGRGRKLLVERKAQQEALSKLVEANKQAS